MSTTEKLASFIIQLDHVRIAHWQTRVYSAHKALGKFYEQMSEFVDWYAESSQAQDPLVFTDPLYTPTDISLVNIDTDEKVNTLFAGIEETLRNADGEPSEFVNKRDELLAQLKRTQYLLKMT